MEHEIRLSLSDIQLEGLKMIAYNTNKLHQTDANDEQIAKSILISGINSRVSELACNDREALYRCCSNCTFRGRPTYDYPCSECMAENYRRNWIWGGIVG